MNKMRSNQHIDLAKGILFGLTVPFISYAVLLLVNEKISGLLFSSVSKEDMLLDNKTIAILAICFNLIPFHLFDKRRQTKGMRGILISTFLLVLLWLFVYGKEAMTLS